MRPERASRLIGTALHLGTAQALSARVRRDFQELRVIVPCLLGDDLDDVLMDVSAGLARIDDRLARTAVDTALEAMPKEGRR